MANRVIGRFAPSPTGPLHFGSLLAALSSYASAKHHDGLWYLRIDNIDPAREQPGASESFLGSLSAHGLSWDGEVHWQMPRLARYREILSTLIARDLVYACDCSRAARASAGSLDCLGPCRRGEHQPASHDRAWRLRSDDTPIRYHDRQRGELTEQLTHSCGDAVLWRRDDLPAYQLATVVDDHDMGITEVVRGADLLDNTARQCHLIDSLGWTRPAFLHIPTLLNGTGQKLSKQSHARALDSRQASHNLYHALVLLRQCPPASLASATVSDILAWAVAHWQEHALPTTDITHA